MPLYTPYAPAVTQVVIPETPPLLTAHALAYCGSHPSLLDWQDWLDQVGAVRIFCGDGSIPYTVDNGYVVRHSVNSAWAYSNTPVPLVCAQVPEVGKKWKFMFLGLGSKIGSRDTGSVKSVVPLEDIDE